jgi:signal transduction histidine kinase
MIRCYVVAAGAVVASAFLRLVLDPVFGDESPMLAFVVGVAVAALYGGRGPGLFATAFSVVLGQYYFVGTRYTFVPNSTLEIVRQALFAFEGVVISYLSGLLRDSVEENRVLTERVRRHNEELEGEVRRRTGELARSNEALETFVHTISHDIRAPLRSIRGFANIIEQDFATHLPAGGREYTSRIAAAALRLDALVNNLLAYTRLGQREIQPEPVSLDRLTEQVVQDLDEEIQHDRAGVEVAPNLGSVMAHRDTLGLILTNLITNGLKYVAAGRAPHVRVSAVAAGPMVRLVVSDNGIGVAHEDRRRIFQPFERLHNRGVYPGSGLGLALVARGIERMGGHCGVESDGHNGSDFWIELPATWQGAADASTDSAR